MSRAIRNDQILSQGFTVIQGTMLRASPHHIVYTSNLFSGDSGGAVICSENGNVIALHLETVNEAHEKLENSKLTLKIVNESVNSLLSGLSQGFIGFRLDTEIVASLLQSNEIVSK
jgi:hypothetical protein